MKISFHSHANEINFHMKGRAPGLAFMKRPMVIRKWSILRITSVLQAVLSAKENAQKIDFVVFEIKEKLLLLLMSGSLRIESLRRGFFRSESGRCCHDVLAELLKEVFLGNLGTAPIRRSAVIT